MRQVIVSSLEIPKHMASLGSALNSKPLQMQRGMAVAVGGMRHEVTWRDRGKDLRVLSLSALLRQCASTIPKMKHIVSAIVMCQGMSCVLSLSFLSLPVSPALSQ